MFNVAVEVQQNGAHNFQFKERHTVIAAYVKKK